MFRHYCFMFGLPSRRHSHALARRRRVHRRTRARPAGPGPRSRVGARIERLKLIRVYDRRIKPSIYRVSREDRQLMCRSRGLRSAIVAFAESISVFIPCEIADDSATTTTTNDDALSFRGRIRGDSAARKRTESRSFTSESFIIKRAFAPV